MGPAHNDAVEEQNDRITESLSYKVSRLKALAVDIETETKDQVRFLHGIGDDFDSSQNLLSNTVGRVKKILTSGRSNRKTMCYVSFFIFAFFILVYYMTPLLFSKH